MADTGVFSRYKGFNDFQEEARKNGLAEALTIAKMQRALRPSSTDIINEAAIRAAQGAPQDGDQEILSAFGALHPRSNVATLGGEPTVQSSQFNSTQTVNSPMSLDAVLASNGGATAPTTAPQSPAMGKSGGTEPLNKYYPDAGTKPIAVRDSSGLVTIVPSDEKFDMRTNPNAALNGGAPVTGAEYLKTITNPQMAAAVKLIGDGSEKSSTLLARLPGAQRLEIMSHVAKYNPEYNANQFKARGEFNVGKLGNQVRSFNTSIAHLDTLGQLADALNNGDVPMLNKLANYYASATGEAAPQNFDTARQIVGAEIIKAVVGASGALGDREEAAQAINKASSPAQLRGVINTYSELMKGQLGSLKLQYKGSTGLDDFDKFLTPEAIKTENEPAVVMNAKAAFNAKKSGALTLQEQEELTRLRAKHRK